MVNFGLTLSQNLIFIDLNETIRDKPVANLLQGKKNMYKRDDRLQLVFQTRPLCKCFLMGALELRIHIV